MQKNFVSSLFYLALILALPLSIIADKQSPKKDHVLSDSELDDHNNSYLYLDENWNEFADLIARLNTLDNNESSPIYRLNNQIADGASIVLKHDILKACAHANHYSLNIKMIFLTMKLTYVRAILNESIDALLGRNSVIILFTHVIPIEVNNGCNPCKVCPGPQGKKANEVKWVTQELLVTLVRRAPQVQA